MNSKSNFSKYTILFTITYFVSYITRINYGAIISDMEFDYCTRDASLTNFEYAKKIQREFDAVSYEENGDVILHLGD